MESSVIISALLGLFAWLTVQIMRIQDETVRNITQRLADATFAVVRRLEEEVARELRAAVKDGKVDRAELLALRDVAIAEVKRYAGVRGMRLTLWILGMSTETLDAIIINELESQLRRAKVK